MKARPRAIRVAVWCYRRLLIVYPRAFRLRYAAPMAQLFRDKSGDAYARAGARALVATCLRAAVDLAANAALERVGPARRAIVRWRSRPVRASARSGAEAAAQDVRIAARRLWKEPSFTIAIVLTLALGIGATTTIFSIVNGVLLRPLPYRESNRLVTLWQWNQAKGIDEAPAPANFLDWRDASRFLEIAAAEPFGMDLTHSGDPVALDTWRVSEGFFETLGAVPMLGRTFLPEEHLAGRTRVVLLSHALWRTRFGGDGGVLGRTLTLDGEPHVVVGVMPPRIDYPSRKDIWTPKVFGDYERKARAQTYYRVIARLRPGATIAQAREELQATALRLAAAYPRTNKGVGVSVVPLFDHVTAGVRPALFVLLAAVGFVLFIACANAANLLLVRAASRRAEIAVRAALGAGRVRLARLMLTESGLLAAVGGVLGVAAAYWATAAVVKLAPPDLPRIDDVALDVRVVAFAVAMSALTSLVCGLAPAIQLSRGTDGVVRASGRSIARGGGGFRNTLATAQTALALILLIGCGLLLRSFEALLRVDLGYQVNNRVALTMHVWDYYPEPHRRAAFVADAVDRMAGQPGVLAVGAASALPLSHEGSEMDPPYLVEGHPVPQPGDEPTALVTFVTPGYFQAIGMRLVRGRLLTPFDSSKSAAVIVVNETMARHAWPGENPLGKRITSRLSVAGTASREVVGVVGDVRQSGLHDRPQPAYYAPHAQAPFGSMTFIARVSAEPAAVAPLLQRAVWSINPVVSIAAVETLDSLLRETLAARRFTLTLLSGFSGLALVLAAVGLYGLVSFSVNQRRAEIGIRMALGADVRSVLALIMRDGLTIVGAGLAAGLIGSLALTRYLSAMLFNVTPTDPVTFAALVIAMGAVAAVACYVAARRATRVDPLIVMRAE